MVTPSPSGEVSAGDRILRVLLALVAVTPFVVVPGFFFPFVIPRAAWFRILVAAGMVILAWLWAHGDRRVGPARWTRERVALALTAYTAVVVAAAALGGHPLQGLLGSFVRMGGAVAWVHYLLFFVLLRCLLDEESWLPFLRLVGLVSVAVTAWALLEAYGGSWFGIALLGWQGERVAGPVGVAGPLAGYLLLSAAVAAYLATRAGRRSGRIGWSLVLAVELWTVMLTGTRAALVGAAAAALLLAAWAVVARRRTSRVRRLAVWGLAAVGLAVVGVALLGGRVFPGVERLLDLGPDALASRIPMWRAAWEGFPAHPLLGVGPESFDLVFDRHFRPGDYLAAPAAYHDRAHNVLVGALAESGVLGLLVYVAFWAAVLGAVVWAFGRAEREPGLLWLGAGVLAYFVYLLLWFEDLTSFHLLLVVVAFLEQRRLAAGGPEREGTEPEAAAEPPGGRTRTEARPAGWKGTAAVGAAVVLLAGTGFYHAQVLGAARATLAGMSARKPLAPFLHFGRALDRPLTSEEQITSRYVVALRGLAGLRQRGEAVPDSAQVSGLFRRGERALRRQMRREAPNSLAHARLAGLYVARWQWSGDSTNFREAVQEYRRALEISPGRVRYLHHIARLYSQHGDPERAMEVLRRALDRLPGWWETYDVMARVQWDAGDRERAVAFLLRAARTDVRRRAAGTGSRFMVRAGSWLEARGTPMQAVELFEAYLASRYPGWDEPPGRRIADVPGDALPIAARLPITLLHVGRTEEARRAARRLLQRLPPHLQRPVVTDRLERFIEDMAAGRTGPWLDRWGVLPTDVPLEG